MPDKFENTVTLDVKKPSQLAAIERDILRALDGKADPETLLSMAIAKQLGRDAELPIATYRREIGKMKALAAVDYIQGCIDTLGENVLVFAYHREVIEAIALALKEYAPCIITGSTPMVERDRLVKLYQSNSDYPLFIGNIQAAGVGLTLTKATRVIFLEYSWVHAENAQAADRAHRIGQKISVVVDYLVFKDSLDESILKTARRKAGIAERFFHGIDD